MYMCIVVVYDYTTPFHVSCDQELKFPDLDCSKYGASVQKILDFQIKLKLLVQSFDLAVEDIPEDCQTKK